MAKILYKSSLFFILGIIFVSFSNNVSADTAVFSSTPEISTFYLLPTKSVNEPYFQALRATGGTQPYVWSIASGSLPPSLSINVSTGEISGTPTIIGNFSFIVAVTDINSVTGTKEFGLVIAPQSTTGFQTIRTPAGDTVVSPITVHVQGVFGVDFCADPRTSFYRIQYRGTGGTGDSYSSYKSHAQGDVVDDYVVINLNTGAYSSATLYCDTGQGLITYTIDGSFTAAPLIPEITSFYLLPTRTVSQLYSQILQASGGIQPYTWSISAGSLPTGLSVNVSTGEIYGIPTVTGNFSFTVNVTDMNPVSGTKEFGLVIAPQSTTGFQTIRTPAGDTVVSPITVHVQGVFGVDFCADPRISSYRVQYNGSGGTPNALSSRQSHAQGDVVDDYVAMTLSIGTYSSAVLFCDTGNGILTYSVDGNLNVVPIQTKVEVTIDIKPGTFPNTINLDSKGSVPVAIFSTTEFDATTVDPLTVTLAGATVKAKGNGIPMASFHDVNNDGLLDLLVHINTKALQLSESDTTADFVGYTFDGTEVIGSDSIIVKK